ncbi:MAG: von Willebrand factor type A domain-containing protein [Thermoanaerobaculia bacterium]
MNTPLKNFDIETLLASEPAPAPPADLGERLKNDLAAHLSGPQSAAAAPILVYRPFRDPKRRWQLAASLAILAIGSTFALVVWRGDGLASRPRDLGVPAKVAGGEAAQGQKDGPAPAAPVYRHEAPAAGEAPSLRAASPRVEIDAERSQTGAAGARQIAPPPAPPAELAAAQPRGSADGGIEGGVAGAVAGGVPGSVVGGVASSTAPEAAAVQESITVTGEAPATHVAHMTSSEPPAAKPASPASGSESAQKLKALGYLGGRQAQLQDEKRADDRDRRWAGSGRYVENERAKEVPATAAAPSTGGTEEPNDQPVGDMFFRATGTNPFIDTDDDRLSTFGLDVDTGSFTLARGYLERGALPPAEAIRVEEFVNYFPYPERRTSGADFTLHVEGAPTPFVQNDRYRLLRLHLQAKQIDARDRRDADLIFVIDVSGSMAREDRLELVKRALTLLLGELGEGDRVGLVTFGSNARVLLEPTRDLEAIRRAIGRLVPEGSTNTEEGLEAAYDLADRSFRERAIHRLILCSDGVANVGATGPESILARIGKAARRGIELETVGFGMGNYNDVLMEQLADQGDGHYAYVDTLDEARRVFVENLNATLQTIARDAKIQVEFDPRTVERYRLVGYENRDVADRDFRNDRVDAGEIGAGHEVTALYELKLARGASDLGRRDPVATVRLRYKSAGSGRVIETGWEVKGGDFESSYRAASPNFHLAATVAELGEILKGTYWSKQVSLDEVAREAAALARSGDFGREVDDLADFARRAARLAPAEPGSGRVPEE